MSTCFFVDTYGRTGCLCSQRPATAFQRRRESGSTAAPPDRVRGKLKVNHARRRADRRFAADWRRQRSARLRRNHQLTVAFLCNGHRQQPNRPLPRVPEPSLAVQPAPIEDLVGVDFVRTRHSCNRRSRGQRLFNNLALQFYTPLSPLRLLNRNIQCCRGFRPLFPSSVW